MELFDRHQRVSNRLFLEGMSRKKRGIDIYIQYLGRLVLVNTNAQNNRCLRLLVPHTWQALPFIAKLDLGWNFERVDSLTNLRLDPFDSLTTSSWYRDHRGMLSRSQN